MNIDDWFDKEMASLDEMLDSGQISLGEYRVSEKEIRQQYEEMMMERCRE